MGKGPHASCDIATLVGGEYPFAVAARLLSVLDVDPYYLPQDGYRHDLARILSRHKFLVLGDLPRAPEEDASLPALRRWIEEDGGTALYFMGRDDGTVVRANADLFGVGASTGTVESGPFEVCWRSASRHPRMPDLEYLHSMTTAGAQVIASSPDGCPEIIRMEHGSGSMTLILGPITFNGGPRWILDPNFGAVVSALLGVKRNHVIQSGMESQLRNGGVAEYAAAIQFLANDNAPGSVRTLMDAVQSSATSAVVLPELCRALRFAGRRAGDPIAVVYSLRHLLDKWTDLREDDVYGFSERHRHWTEMKHEVDLIYQTQVSVREGLARAMAALDACENEAGQWREPGVRDQIDGMREYLGGLARLAEATRHGKPLRDTLAGLHAAAEEILLASARPFASPRMRATVAYLRAVENVNVGTAESRDPTSQQKLAALREDVDRLKPSLTDANFASSIAHVFQFVDHLIAGRDAAAWEELGTVPDPFASRVIQTLLKVRAALQFDPLGFIDIWADVLPDTRTALADTLAEAAVFRSEGAALDVTIAVVPLGRKWKDLQENSLYQFSLLSAEAMSRLSAAHGEPDNAPTDGEIVPEPSHEDPPRRLFMSSGSRVALVATPEGDVIGAIPQEAKVFGRQRVEDTLIAQARNMLGHEVCVIRIAGLRNHVRIWDQSDLELVFDGRHWSRVKAVTLDFLAATLDPSIGQEKPVEPSKADELRPILDLLSTVRGLSDSWHDYHGTSFLICGSRLAAEMGGKAVAAPLPIDGIEPFVLRQVLAHDHATLINVDDMTLVAYDVVFNPSRQNYNEAIRRHPWLRHRGSRHRNAAAFSLEHPDSAVFVCSQDGGCLAMVAGAARRLW